jgi:hypothetical protein
MDVKDHETRVLALVELVIQEYKPRLSACGITVDGPRVTRAETEGSSAEIEVYFTKAGDIVDAVEFHVHRQGKPSVQLTELEPWLRSTLDDVTARAKQT